MSASIRLDRYAPEWAVGIADDLNASIAPCEALQNAACSLHHEANRAALRGLHHRSKLDSFIRLGSAYLCADDMAKDERRRAEEQFERAQHLRATARDVLRLRGMVVMGRLL